MLVSGANSFSGERVGRGVFVTLAVSLAVFIVAACAIRVSPLMPHEVTPKLIAGSTEMGLADVSECGGLGWYGNIERQSFHGFSYVGEQTITCVIEKRTRDHQCKPEFDKFLIMHGIVCSKLECGGNVVFYGRDEKRVALIFSFLVKLDKDLCISETTSFLSYFHVNYATPKR